MATERSLEVPIRLVSPNVRRRWRSTSNTKDRQQKATAGALLAFGSWRPALPCVVRFTRICWQPYDDDNLRAALKHVRDAVARWLGTHDGRRAPVAWHYAQEVRRALPGYEAVRIDVEGSR